MAFSAVPLSAAYLKNKPYRTPFSAPCFEPSELDLELLSRELLLAVFDASLSAKLDGASISDEWIITFLL